MWGLTDPKDLLHVVVAELIVVPCRHFSCSVKTNCSSLRFLKDTHTV